MKKKGLVVVSVMLLLALSICTLVSCGPSSPDKYLEKMKEATYGTFTTTTDVVGAKMEASVAMNGEEFSVLIKTGDKTTLEICFVKDGDKSTLYSKIGDKWTKVEDETLIKTYKDTYSSAKVTESTKAYSVKKEDYEIGKDKVWTHKILKYTMQIEDGKLVIKTPSLLGAASVTFTFDAAKPNIKAPKI